MAKKYVISSVQAGASPHTNLLKSIDKYCRSEGAELILLPMIGQSAREDFDQLHEIFGEREVEYGKKTLNNNLKIEQFNVRPYQIDPVTGLTRFVQRGTSIIFASPKQRLTTVSHSNYKIPKFLVTTGALSRPNYATGMDVSAERRRLGNIALRDHVYGALVIDVLDKERFHLRNLRANQAGHFVDLGKRFEGNKTKKAKLEALVLGDWHNGRTDPLVRKANYEIIKGLKPKRIILHDFFDGHSVSHHMDKQPIRQKLLQQKDYGHHILEDELREGWEELREMSQASKGAEIYLVASNHHEFLDRYLDDARYARDITNLRTAFKLADYMAAEDLNDPVEHGLRMMGDLPKNIKFLKRTDDLKVRGYQLASHGDKGPAGGRGSMKSKEDDYGKSITGHCHKPQILRDTYTVGTSLPLNMFYTRGHPTDWGNSHALLWDTGTVQLVTVIDGRWR